MYSLYLYIDYQRTKSTRIAAASAPNMKGLARRSAYPGAYIETEKSERPARVTIRTRPVRSPDPGDGSSVPRRRGSLTRRQDSPGSV